MLPTSHHPQWDMEAAAFIVQQASDQSGPWGWGGGGGGGGGGVGGGGDLEEVGSQGKCQPYRTTSVTSWQTWTQL